MIPSLALCLLLTGPAPPAGIRWERHFEEALKKARASGKPVMVDFWADSCGWCHRLDKTTYVDPVVTKKAEEFVTVRVNAEGRPKEVAVAARYDVTNLPTILFLTPAGRQVLRLTGFQGPGQFPRTLERAKEQAQRVMGLEAVLDYDPKDARALAALGVHLFEQEFYEESRVLLHRAKQFDCEQPVVERRRTRMLLAIVQNYDKNFAEAEALLKEALGFKPEGEDQPKLLFILGRTYVSWGRHSEARETMRHIVEDYAGSLMAEKARETLVVLERKH